MSQSNRSKQVKTGQHGVIVGEIWVNFPMVFMSGWPPCSSCLLWTQWNKLSWLSTDLGYWPCCGGCWRFQVVLFGNFVILNLFLAILMSSFDEQRGKLHDAWAPRGTQRRESAVNQSRWSETSQAMESKRELTRVWHPDEFGRHQKIPVISSPFGSLGVQEVWVPTRPFDWNFWIRLAEKPRVSNIYVPGDVHRATLGLGEWRRLANR